MRDWRHRQLTRWARGTHPACQAGHRTHASRDYRIHLRGQPLADWPPIPRRWERDLTIRHAVAEEYANTHGYCPGDSELARSLRINGCWEGFETVLAMAILDTEPGLVIDLGSNVGWYTLLAASFGHDVLAVDAEPTYCAWLGANLDLGGYTDQVSICHGWLDEDSGPAEPTPVLLVKMDLEGAEPLALRLLAPMLEQGLIEHLLIEITPAWMLDWPEMLRSLASYGYATYRVPDKGADPDAFAADPMQACRAQPLVGDGDQWTLWAERL